jgi:hypothetical protein
LVSLNFLHFAISSQIQSDVAQRIQVPFLVAGESVTHSVHHACWRLVPSSTQSAIELQRLRDAETHNAVNQTARSL